MSAPGNQQRAAPARALAELFRAEGLDTLQDALRLALPVFPCRPDKGRRRRMAFTMPHPIRTKFINYGVTTPAS